MDIEQYYDKIYRYCFFKVNNRSLAEDLTQETFLRFLNSDSRQPERYLYTIAKNLCIDVYRKNKYTEVELEEATELSQGSFENALIDSMDIKKVFEVLPEEEKEVLILRYVSDESMNDISRLLGISRFSAYRRLKEAKRHFGDLLEGRKG